MNAGINSGVKNKEVGKKAVSIVSLSAAALTAIAILTFGAFTAPVSSGLLSSTAHAESKFEALIPEFRAWLDRLRNGATPEGLAKTNGRIEATQIDVAA